jgi:trk system potassium uptake protein
MNYQLISKYLGFLTGAIGLLMLPSMLWAMYFGEGSAFTSFLLSIATTILIAALLLNFGWNASTKMFQREALFMVTASWFVAAFIGAIPYIITGSLGPIDAFFESMSGFTTTGSTVIMDIEAQPKSLLFWRSFTQWIGGVGIVVLAVAVLPYLGAGGKQLYKTESTGTDPRGITPRIKDTASMLYKTYLALTVLMTVLLIMAGMTFYDAPGASPPDKPVSAPLIVLRLNGSLSSSWLSRERVYPSFI